MSNDFLEKNIKLYEALQKAAKDDVSEVASIAVIDGDSILMGRRRDNGRWTLTGGHLDKGEEKAEGAVRELFEEAGIKVGQKDLKYLGSKDVTTFTGKKKKIHAFTYKHDGERPTTKNDPDKEVEKWEWIDCKDGVPCEIADNMHTPFDKNCVFDFLKMKKAEELSKAELEKGQNGDWQKEGYTIHHSDLKPEDIEGWNALHNSVKNGAKGGMWIRPSNRGPGEGGDSWEGASFDGTFNKVQNKITSGQFVRDGMAPFVYAKDPRGNVIGAVHADSQPEILNAWVHPDHQRKGLATAMYDRLGALARYPVSPGGSQTEDAKKFWANRRAARKSDSKSEFEIYKSNYGPKPMKLYNQADNAARKQGRTGTEAEGAGPNKDVKQIAPGGRGTMKDQAKRIAMEAKRKSKFNPVKIYTPEEIAKLNIKTPTAAPKKLVASELEKQDVLDQPMAPDWQSSYLQNQANAEARPENKAQPSVENQEMYDIPSHVLSQLLNSGYLMYHPKRGIIRNRKHANRGDGAPLMRAEEGPLELIHYSPIPGLKEVDPNKMGTSGVRSGGQYKYGLPETKTSFHYIKGTEPEDIVTSGAKSKYKLSVHPQHLYDLGTDPRGLVDQALKANQGAWNTDAIFNHIKKNGYKGVWAPNSDHPVIRGTVQLFHPHPTEKEEVIRA